jgi:hypothetical protein
VEDYCKLQQVDDKLLIGLQGRKKETGSEDYMYVIENFCSH